MLDVDTFADEIFGFHAQQAIEKALKAWIATTGHDYPLTHNLTVLLAQMEEQGLSVGKFRRLVQFNAFAVQFRYGQYESLEGALDRPATFERLTNSWTMLRQLLAAFPNRRDAGSPR